MEDAYEKRAVAEGGPQSLADPSRDATPEFPNVNYRLGDVLSRDRIQAGHIATIAAGTPVAMGGSLTNTVIMGTTLWVAGATPEILWWTLGSGLLFTWMLWKWFKQRHYKPSDPFKPVSSRAYRRVIIFSIVSALPWAALALIYVNRIPTTYEMVLMCTMAGMAAGGSYFMARVPLGAMCYMGILLGTTFVACVTQGTTHHFLIAGFTLVYMTFLVLSIVHYANLTERLHSSLRQLGQYATDLMTAKSRMERIAKRDTITRLYNRRAFTEIVASSIADARKNDTSLALFIADLDAFKSINDSLGHPAGDALLAELAERLDLIVKQTGDAKGFAARLGGDEFALVLRDIKSEDEANRIAQKIVERFSEPTRIGGHRVSTGVSVGAGRYPCDASTVNELLHAADRALISAKALPSGSICIFDEQMSSDLRQEKRDVKALRNGLNQDELCLFYQPQVSLETGKIYGFEALVRWQHPDEGMVPPGRFFTSAERSGLILEISDRAVELAHRQLADWLSDGLEPGTISMNIHATQLKQADRLTNMLDRLKSENDIAEHVVLEITEGCIVGRGTENVPALLDAMRERGYRISLDDFGTGFASLIHLRELPIDEIKIDRSFTSGIMESRQNMAIVWSMIQLAQALDFNIVVEGIETREQATALRQHGQIVGQGYHFSKPMSVDDVTALLRREMWNSAVSAAPRAPQALIKTGT
ncbi:MAG: EAL domain-containing protein [Pseudomonadota bacterium]